MTTAHNGIPRFLCVDDDADAGNALIQRLINTSLMTVEFARPAKYEDQLNAIRKGKYDGLIIDYILSGQLNPETNERARYTSNSIAQGVRDASVSAIGDPDGGAAGESLYSFDIPIILWSSQANYLQFYEKERTGHDLYDVRYEKSQISREPARVAEQLCALAGGYGRIRESRGLGRTGFARMLGLGSVDEIEPRIGSHFSRDERGEVPEHEYSRYVMHELIEQPYPLVDEVLIAARLGVDIVVTPRDVWNNLMRHFDSAKYTGIFSDGWPRWWWDKIVQVGLEHGLDIEGFQYLPAEDRVRALHPVAGHSLCVQTPIEPSYGTAYWTICEAFSKPLDPSDAFISTYTSTEPWHDGRYISLKGAMERIKLAEGLAVAPLELPRFEAVARANAEVATEERMRGRRARGV